MSEIIGNNCSNCSKKIYPKRLFCPRCRSNTLEDWVLPSQGTLFSFTTVNFPLDKYEHPPYQVGLISLDERNESLITARIIDESKIKIGLKVQLTVKTYDESGSLKIITATPV